MKYKVFVGKNNNSIWHFDTKEDVEMFIKLLKWSSVKIFKVYDNGVEELDEVVEVIDGIKQDMLF